MSRCDCDGRRLAVVVVAAYGRSTTRRGARGDVEVAVCVARRAWHSVQKHSLSICEGRFFRDGAPPTTGAGGWIRKAVSLATL